MTIKRTELEILDQAIQFAADKQAMQDELKLLQDSPLAVCCQEERKYKNTDLEGIKKMYEVRINNLEYEHRAEINRKIRETELEQGIIALKDNIELLRWLYKDNTERNKQ